LVARAGEPVVRAAAMQAMRILGEQFVLGRTIEAGLKRGAGVIRAGRAASFSFDILGGGARAGKDAVAYVEAYARAMPGWGEGGGGKGAREGWGVSVKMSALYPRYEARQEERVMSVLYPRLLGLAEAAKKWNIGFTLDAEEADRLVLSLKIFEALA